MKVLYLIHVCWEWIFQRPQILELHLQNDYQCTVVNKRYLFNRKTTKNNKMPKNSYLVYQLPGGGRVSLIRYMNEFIYRQALKKCHEYDCIWVCYPELFKYIPESYKGKVIYDCMDNHVAMAKEHEKEYIYELEQRLIKRADIIFVSSNKLQDTIPNIGRVTLVRNGFKEVTPLPLKKADIRMEYKIGYIGTISAWFDFELLKKSVRINKTVEYYLLGPVSSDAKTDIVQDITEIKFEGVIEHQFLENYIVDYDALIMPFIVNDIILSVDPVKLYEYICFGKCIISVWYPEIERFEPYVYFYHNEEEYIKLIEKLTVEGFPTKYNSEQQLDFLEKNTWESRYKIIKREVDKLFQ